MFETATHRFIQGVNGVTIHTVVMGEGEPLLLLHGHPETYLMWHKVAGDLAHRFTVVMCDLRGYGDSDKPEGLPDHSTYSKRIMAEDCIAVMGKLGFDRFSVMGHDRGARVAYRMALDHPEVVNKLVLLDIVSTYDMYALSSAEFAKALFHWYLLTQDEPFPEDLILSSRKMYFRNALHIGRYNSENDTSSEAFPQEVYDEYLRTTTWNAFTPFARNTVPANASIASLIRKTLMRARKSPLKHWCCGVQTAWWKSSSTHCNAGLSSA